MVRIFFGEDGFKISSASLTTTFFTALVSDEPLIDAFTARFPNVALNLTNDVSKYLDGRIDRAFYANDEYIDVAMLETLQDYTRWKAENRLLYYKAAVWNDIVNGKKDLDGAYVPYELGKPPVVVLETISPSP